ncbi:helix-turn-helix domain-containing protein [Micromonospora sp. DT233]|uniref:helix-turn-helix domain-containing protein n=1 Tax=Micromonospora sp. DT233 TaxID=3393432 RepID=UPI003CF4F377
MDDLPIGQRVAYWRGRRKMSQQQFADAVGKSKSWVDKVERGARRLDKVSCLEDIADALRIDLRLLLGRDGARKRGAGGPDEDAVDAVRGTLARWAPVKVGDDGRPASLDNLNKEIIHAWLSYQHARYPTLIKTLPSLLTSAQRVQADHPGDRVAARRLAEAYQVTSAVMRKVGVHDVAWLAADRALTASQFTDDALLAGVSAAHLSQALFAQGNSRYAMEIGIAASHRLAPPEPLDAPPEHLSVYGSLLVAAALGAAALGSADCAAELVDRAAEAADVVGIGQNHYWTAFGPVAVELARVSTAVELGHGAEPGEHQRLAERVDYQRMPPERRADYLLDVARGYLLTGDLDGAGKALVAADWVASAEVRHRPIGHEVVTTLLRRSKKPGPDVLRLADAMGVGV